MSQIPLNFSAKLYSCITWEVDSSSPDKICINVCNGGEPISPEVLSKLTQPFFSTKPSGTGLGLAITKRIVNAHGGELSIGSDTVTGTRVSVQLPVVVLRSF
jgi:signal transduction histidine kinase